MNQKKQIRYRRFIILSVFVLILISCAITDLFSGNEKSGVLEMDNGGEEVVSDMIMECFSSLVEEEGDEFISWENNRLRNVQTFGLDESQRLSEINIENGVVWKNQAGLQAEVFSDGEWKEILIYDHYFLLYENSELEIVVDYQDGKSISQEFDCLDVDPQAQEFLLDRIAFANIETPCDDSPLPLNDPQADSAYIVVEPMCGDPTTESVRKNSETDEWERVTIPGTEIHIEGYNFYPEKDVEIWWVDPLGNTWRHRQDGEYVSIIPNEAGYFEIDIIWPFLLIEDDSEALWQIQGRQSFNQ